MNINNLQNMINRKREEFRKFDALPPAEQKRLTDQGLNPHEPESIRTRKQDRLKRQSRAEARAKLSKEEYQKLVEYGYFDTSHERKDKVYRCAFVGTVNVSEVNK